MEDWRFCASASAAAACAARLAAAMKSDCEASLAPGPCRLAALVAHALHDGVEVRRAGTGFQRLVGEFGIERLVQADRRHVGSGRGTGQLRNFRFLPAEGTGKAAEQGLAAAALLRLFGDGIGSERGKGGGGGGLRGRARHRLLAVGRGRFCERRHVLHERRGTIGIHGGRIAHRDLGLGQGRGRLSLLQRAEPVDDLQQRVVNGLEGLGVALVGATGQRFQHLQVFGKPGDGRCPDIRSGQRTHGIFRRVARRSHDRILRRRKRSFDIVEPGGDVLEFRQRRSGLRKMRGKTGDLRFEAANELRIDAGHLGGRGVEAGRDIFQPGLQVADGGGACRIGCPVLQPLRERGEAGIDGFHDVGAVHPGGGRTFVEPGGDLMQPLLQILENQAALFQGIALPAFQEVGKRLEPLFQPLQEIIRIRHCRRLVDPVGDQGDLLAEPFHRLLRQVAVGGEIVDARRQHVEARNHLFVRSVGRHFLDLGGEGIYPLFDTFQRFGIEAAGLRGDGRGDDRP